MGPTGPHREPEMPPALFKLYCDTFYLALETQRVMALRAARIAMGGAVAQRETQRMISEKATAAATIGARAATELAGGTNMVVVADNAVTAYRSRVVKNRRRLAATPGKSRSKA